jgi:hypothetical protein
VTESHHSIRNSRDLDSRVTQHPGIDAVDMFGAIMDMVRGSYSGSRGDD